MFLTLSPLLSMFRPGALWLAQRVMKALPPTYHSLDRGHRSPRVKARDGFSQMARTSCRWSMVGWRPERILELN